MEQLGQVLAGLGNAASHDSQSQAQSLQCFEQLKNSADGWKLCVQAYLSEAHIQNGLVRFICLQVCEHYLKTRYHQANNEEQSTMQSFLMSSLQYSSREDVQEETHLQNKIAQIVCLAFVADYPSRWPSFFDQLLTMVDQGNKATSMYLKVLLSIDQDVMDKDILHTQEEWARCTVIKDRMRESAVVQLASSWLKIMQIYTLIDTKVVCSCLDVVGRYISWIDIGLVANKEYVEMLLQLLEHSLIRESCCDCICEVFNKGMEPISKLHLVESFFSVLEKNGILNPPIQDEKCDFLAKLSKLVCSVGLALINSWSRADKSPSDQADIYAALETKIPYLLKFLGNEDDDVSGAVAQFASEYISLLKIKGTPLSQAEQQNVQSLLRTVVSKMKYDESYSFEQEGEDEAMFDEFRKQMTVIFTNLGQLDTELVLLTVTNIVSETLPKWKTLDFRDTEMALNLMYKVAEAVPAPHGQHFMGNNSRTSALHSMMRTLMTSHVSHHGHVAVQQQFFEVVVRYDKFFQAEQQYIPECLSAFLDCRGLRHNSPKVRSRCAYLFSRLVKTVKAYVLPVLEVVLTQMKDLLTLNPPANGNTNGVQYLLSDEDQLFIYETASILIIASPLPPEKKEELMNSLLTPIAVRFKELLASLLSETNEERQAVYGKCIYNAMGLASRVSKGFSASHTMKMCGCEAAFTELLKLFCQALDTPSERSHVQCGVRQYLHRMVVCMDEDILQLIPGILPYLLRHPEAKEVYDFLPLLNQLVMKLKRKTIEFVSQIVMPLVNTIFTLMNVPAEESDQQAAQDRKQLQQGYYQFLSVIVSNSCADVFKVISEGDLEKVLMSVVHGMIYSQDPASQRSCFIIFKKLTEVWGSDDGFVQFLYKEVVPACFQCPLHESFDLSDAQASLTLGECSAFLRTMLAKRGQELINFLHSYLSTGKLSMEKIQMFCQVLQTTDKNFKIFLKEFFLAEKS